MDNNYEFTKIKTKQGETFFIKNLKFLNDCSIIIEDNENEKDKSGINIRRFDISNLNCDFYELCLNVDMPDETLINVYYYLSNNNEILFESPIWMKSQINHHNSNMGCIIPEENDKKYLWVKIELSSSNISKTPTLKSINLSPILRVNVSNLNGDFYELSLDADVYDETLINVYYYLSNNAEIFFDPLKWTESHINHYISSMGCIFPKKGNEKYLWVKIELTASNISKTLELRSIKLREKTSYLNNLPEIYQQNEDSKEFLERFLSIFESFFHNSEEKIKNVSKYLDPDETPSEFLPWLGSWTSTVFNETPSEILSPLGNWTSILYDKTWTDDKKREFLKRAVEFYKIKGTKKGIEELIKLYIDIELKDIIFIENWENFYELNDNNEFKLKYKYLEDNELDNNELDKNVLHDNELDNNVLYDNELVEDKLNERKLDYIELSNDESDNNKLIDYELDRNKGFKEFFRTDDLFHFQVILVPEDCKSIVKNILSEIILNKLLEHEKPANTTCKGIVLKQGIYLNHHSYIGINSSLTKIYPEIGKDSIIGEMFCF